MLSSYLRSVSSSAEWKANESSSAIHAQRGAGSPRAAKPATASSVKNMFAISRRMGRARQLPPEKIRSSGAASNACASTGASSSSGASAVESVKKMTRRIRCSHVALCMRQRVEWKRCAVISPTTTSCSVSLPLVAASNSAVASSTSSSSPDSAVAAAAAAAWAWAMAFGAASAGCARTSCAAIGVAAAGTGATGWQPPCRHAEHRERSTSSTASTISSRVLGVSRSARSSAIRSAGADGACSLASPDSCVGSMPAATRSAGGDATWRSAIANFFDFKFEFDEARWLTSAMSVSSNSRLGLEELAYAFGTDKSHDDHKYTDLYAALLDPIRASVRNMTEIGVSAGQSLQMWHEYFFAATVFGVDIFIPASTRRVAAELRRARLFKLGSANAAKLAKLGLAEGSMDVIVDDGDHFPATQQATLHLWWPYLRPGGYYIVEDVATGANMRNQMRYQGKKDRPGWSQLAHNRSFWLPRTVEIFAQNDVYAPPLYPPRREPVALRTPALTCALRRRRGRFFVDSLVGHRAFAEWWRQTKEYTHDEVSHNSHVLVIRRRLEPRTREVDVHRGRVAMRHGQVKSLRGAKGR